MSALVPDSDKPRLVADFVGCQIFDARETIRFKVKHLPAPRGLPAGLKVEGFTVRQAGEWEAKNTPQNIFAAQLIANEYFPTRP